MAWAIKDRNENLLDGKRESLIGRFGPNTLSAPDYLAGYTIMVFETRAEARQHIQHHYGYIAKRPDLRAEPHGWKMPIAVRVTVTVSEE